MNGRSSITIDIGSLPPTGNESSATAKTKDVIIVKADKSVGVANCCHEKAKEQAILQQKLEFMEHQLDEERARFKKKESHLNQMLEALQSDRPESLATFGGDDEAQEALEQKDKAIEELKAELAAEK